MWAGSEGPVLRDSVCRRGPVHTASLGVGGRALSGFCLSLAGAKAGESVGVVGLVGLSIQPLTR